MDVTVQIPDDLASRMGAGGDLPRRALEALAAEEYKRGGGSLDSKPETRSTDS